MCIRTSQNINNYNLLSNKTDNNIHNETKTDDLKPGQKIGSWKSNLGKKDITIDEKFKDTYNTVEEAHNAAIKSKKQSIVVEENNKFSVYKVNDNAMFDSLELTNNINIDYKSAPGIIEIIGDDQNSLWIETDEKTASSTNTPKQTLSALAKSPNSSVRELIASNPNSTNEILEFLSRDKIEFVKAAVARNPKTPMNVLKNLSESSNWNIRKEVAKNPSVSSDILIKLAKDDFVQMDVMKNPNLPKEATQILLNDKNEYTRAFATGLKNVPLKDIINIYNNLTGDSKEIVANNLKKIINNPNISKEDLKIISKEVSDLNIKYSIASNPNTPKDILQALSKDKDAELRGAVGINPNIPKEILQALSKDNSDYVRDSIARNPNAPKEMLQTLSKDNNVYVRAHVASNPNTPKETLINLASDSEESVKNKLFDNQNTPMEAYKVLSKDSNEVIRELVARDLKTPKDILISLSKDNFDNVTSSLVTNPNTPKEAFINIAKFTDGYYTVMRLSKSSSPEALEVLSNHKSEYVRADIASNSHTPKDVLTKLTKDPVREVRVRASNTLKALK